jgi:hypothetical protein
VPPRDKQQAAGKLPTPMGNEGGGPTMPEV